MLSKLFHPGSLVWSALALMLAFIAILLIAFPHIRMEGVDFAQILHLASVTFGWMAAGVVAAALGWMSLMASHSPDRSVDIAFLMTALCWLLLLGCEAVAKWAGAGFETAFATHAIYQMAVASVVFLLLASVSLSKVLRKVLRWLQAGPVLVLLGWGFLFLFELDREPVYLAWKVVNVLCAIIVFLALTSTLRQRSNARSRLLCGVGLFGLGILLHDMAVADGTSVSLTAIHHGYAAYLALVWLLITGRISDPDGLQSHGGQRSENSVLANEFAHSDLISAAEGYQSSQTNLTLSMERRRIAQELHDGVGSQLVNILSSLDRGSPQQRSLACALEHCLLDVKILVDAIDESSESVIDALGRLRYRVQHSLDKLGIRLVWDVDVDGPLHLLPDERSRQILRVAQESIANVMRHSRARTLWLSCHCQLDPQTLVLEVRDDGVGFEIREGGPDKGKGLQGMRRRALACGGQLEIQSTPGTGTTVRITMAWGEWHITNLNGTYKPWNAVSRHAVD